MQCDYHNQGIRGTGGTIEEMVRRDNMKRTSVRSLCSLSPERVFQSTSAISQRQRVRCKEKTRNLLLCERAQQKATMVAISTKNATPAPTATPMMTAIGTDSGKTRKQKKWRWALDTINRFPFPQGFLLAAAISVTRSSYGDLFRFVPN